MPSPRNRIKQTGDTHDVVAAYELDASLDDEVDGSGTQSEVAQFDSAASGLEAGSRGGRLASTRAALQDRGRQLGSSGKQYLNDAQDQVRAQPLKALGGAFLLGFVLARLTR